MNYRTTSAQQTKALAARLAKTLRGGEVLALQGELGSGKTTFVQGLARALGVKKSVRSPTFTLVQCYRTKNLRTKEPKNQTRFVLCHVDAYRLDNKTDPGDLGLHDYMGQPDTITVIEWPERIRGILPKKTIWIKFLHEKKENTRSIIVGRGFIPRRGRGQAPTLHRSE